MPQLDEEAMLQSKNGTEPSDEKKWQRKNGTDTLEIFFLGAS